MKTLLILFLSAITASAAVGVAPSGGSGSGANWTASGTTNSTLSGDATVNALYTGNAIISGVGKITNSSTSTVPLVVNHASGATADALNVNVGGNSLFKVSPAYPFFTLMKNAGVGGSLVGFKLADAYGWAIGFATDVEKGWFEIVDRDGAIYHRWYIGDYLLSSTGVLGFSSEINYATAGVGARDLSLSRDAAATLQLGIDAATETAQTLKAHDGSGTDKNGASLTLEGGQSTGIGRGGALITKTSLTGSTGSSANSYTTRTYTAAKFVDLTESSATLVFNVTVGSGKIITFKVFSKTMASDGTDFQANSDEFTVTAVNKGGTLTFGSGSTNGIKLNSNDSACSTGTLTSTWTAVANGNSIDVKCNAVSSLTQTTLRSRFAILSIASDDVATVIPQ